MNKTEKIAEIYQTLRKSCNMCKSKELRKIYIEMRDVKGNFNGVTLLCFEYLLGANRTCIVTHFMTCISYIIYFYCVVTLYMLLLEAMSRGTHFP